MANNIKKRNWLFYAILFIITFALYGNTMFNDYSLDDHHISPDDAFIQQGINGIPEIFTNLYSTGEENNLSYGYRPVMSMTYAIEYEFTKGDPMVSHLINVLFYFLSGLFLFKLLRRLLNNYTVYLPFFITLLFIAHPIHTEVVASLKNRDEIMAFGFFVLSLHSMIRYADLRRNIHIFWGVLFYLLALMSKVSVITTLLVFPLAFYFFTELKPRKILYLSLFIILAVVLSRVAYWLWLPDLNRSYQYIENPLVYEGEFWTILGTGFYVLLYYLRLLIFPHPLVYYYGYDTVPIMGMDNVWPVLSLLIHGGLFVVAVWKFKSRHILSFAILYYLTTIAAYSNILTFVPGIIGERFLFIPSLGFVIALVYGIFRLFGAGKEQEVPVSRFSLAGILVAIILILIPYSVKTYSRNKAWRTSYTLYKTDIRHLGNSVKAHDLLADELMKRVYRELSKPVDVTKFVRPSVEKAMRHWEKAVEIYPGHYSSWTNMGIVHARVFKAYEKAARDYRKAIRIKPDHGKALFNYGVTLEQLGKTDSAILLYEKCIELDPDIINPRSRLANALFLKGYFQKAIRLNEEIMELDPDEPLPYLSFGNYYMSMGDTLKGIRFYEQAVELDAPMQVSMFLSKFFRERGNESKAEFYRKKVTKEAGRPQK